MTTHVQLWPGCYGDVAIPRKGFSDDDDDNNNK